MDVVHRPAGEIDPDDQGQCAVGMSDGQVEEHTVDRLLIGEYAVAHGLLGQQSSRGLGHLAERGVHAEEGQQGDGQQVGETGVPVVVLGLLRRDE